MSIPEYENFTINSSLKFFYSTEQAILQKAGISPNNISIRQIRKKSEQIFNENRGILEKSNTFSNLGYQLGFGATAERWRLSEDLKIVAKDSEQRMQTGVLAGTLNDACQAVVFGAISCFSKTGPSNLYRNYYHGHYRTEEEKKEQRTTQMMAIGTIVGVVALAIVASRFS